METMELLGYRKFFRSGEPGTKLSYAIKVGKDDIQRLCCLMLTYCKKGFTPSVDDIIRIWFQYIGKSYLESPAYGFIAEEYDRIARTAGHHRFYLLCEEALLNLYTWATENPEIPESIDQKDGSFMVPLFMLCLLFNEDVLANYDKGLQSAQQHPDRVLMRMILAQRFPQNDLVDIDYGKLVYTQTYKLMELLNFLEATPKYQPLFQHFLEDFQCGNKEDFFKALGGAVIMPLNPNKTGINSLVLNELKEPEETVAFLGKLVFDPGDVSLGADDYKVLRDRPLQKAGNEYRVVFDLFLIKKLYNGIIFKLSDYVNKNKQLLKGPFFGEVGGYNK
ncbi:MAG: hypothetical protein EOO88_15140 [Pedobacter sp.]|nr:MAG: hypothetical protein EOO88_15140 [Pedobacter sp.]